MYKRDYETLMPSLWITYYKDNIGYKNIRLVIIMQGNFASSNYFETTSFMPWGLGNFSKNVFTCMHMYPP